MEHKQIKKRIQRMTSGQPVSDPALLKEIRDYPKELYYIGDPKLLEEKCVSIVGSRKTNQYGRSTAYSFGKGLATERHHRSQRHGCRNRYMRS